MCEKLQSQARAHSIFQEETQALDVWEGQVVERLQMPTLLILMNTMMSVFTATLTGLGIT